MNQFVETKNRFMNAVESIGIKIPVTYEEWMCIDDRYKAITLYCNFYNQITLAWDKAKATFIDEELAVSTLMQYIIKNVSIIKENPKKFKPSYIYTVAYNSMGALRRVKREQDRFDFTTSQFVSNGSDEIDLFATMIGEDVDMINKIYGNKYDAAIWQIISNMDLRTKDMIAYLLGAPRLPARAANHQEEILANLRKELKRFKSYYCDSDKSSESSKVTFKSVLKVEDNIQSATVKMRDGVQAVYYGEKRISPNGVEKVVFFGPDQDYVIPVSIASKLEVTDVEYY